MTLPDYLAQASLSHHEFAASINVRSETVRRYLSGERNPTKSVMARILLATEGKVTPNDFFRMAA